MSTRILCMSSHTKTCFQRNSNLVISMPIGNSIIIRMNYLPLGPRGLSKPNTRFTTTTPARPAPQYQLNNTLVVRWRPLTPYFPYSSFMTMQRHVIYGAGSVDPYWLSLQCLPLLLLFFVVVFLHPTVRYDSGIDDRWSPVCHSRLGSPI